MADPLEPPAADPHRFSTLFSAPSAPTPAPLSVSALSPLLSALAAIVKNPSTKTTIASAVSAGASFILFAQTLHYINFPQWMMGVAMFAQVGGLAAFGIVAKDYNATGGTRPTTTEAAIRVEEAQVWTPPGK